jgi:hypothetical protein
VTVLASSTSAFDEPGTLGFLVVFGMGVLLFFVFRSMAKHLRKVNKAAQQDQAGLQDFGPSPQDNITASAPKNGQGPR